LTRKANAIPGNVDHVNYGYDRGRGGGKEPNPAEANRAKRQNLTFVKGNRAADDLDPVSQQILEVAATGTSIFDPVLCELAYRWFCPPGGLVLDPFAGGSVRGIVAAIEYIKYF
jgi:DNA modification methylase